MRFICNLRHGYKGHLKIKDRPVCGQEFTSFIELGTHINEFYAEQNRTESTARLIQNL